MGTSRRESFVMSTVRAEAPGVAANLDYFDGGHRSIGEGRVSHTTTEHAELYTTERPILPDAVNDLLQLLTAGCGYCTS